MDTRKAEDPPVAFVTPEDYVMQQCMPTGNPCKKDGRKGMLYKCTDSQGIVTFVCVPTRPIKKRRAKVARRKAAKRSR